MPVWGQEQILRLRPPFSGLVINTNQTDIPDNAFFILSNAALTSSGEIYKRGGFGTIPYNSAALRIDLGNGTKGIGSLYRYYTSTGLRRLLATSSNGNFAHWYWLNDTTSRFAYTVAVADTVDSISQVDYRKGRVSIRQNANTNSIFIAGQNDSTKFFMQCSNLSDLRFRYFGATDPALFGSNKSVWVANDTLLAFEIDSLGDVTAAPDTLTNRRYEIHYRTAHNTGNPPDIFYANAMTYLDTIYFSRGIYDPIGWDGKQTVRINVLDAGIADTLRDSTLVQNGKSWTVNQWTGYWLFRRKAAHYEAPATSSALWRTSWTKIKSNTATRLTLDSQKVLQDDATDKSYAIVSLPIDEPIAYCKILLSVFPGLGPQEFEFDSVFVTLTRRKWIFGAPFTLLAVDGSLSGQSKQIEKWADTYLGGSGKDTLWFTRGFAGTATGGDRFLLLKSRFPIAKIVLPFQERTLWISDTTYQNSIYPSLAGRPGYVEPNTQIVINPNDGEFIQSAWSEQDKVMIAKNSKLYALWLKSIETTNPDNPDIWQVVLLSSTVGCEAPKSVVQREATTWFYDWPQGFYQMSNNKLEKISEPIRPMIDSITASARDKVFGVYYPSKKGDLVLWGVPINGSTKPDRFLSYSPATGAWATWNLTNTDAVRIASALVQEGPGDVGELMVGLADSGYVLRYNPEATQDTLRAQGGNRTTTFALIAESKRYELPGVEIRFREIQPILNQSGTGTVAYDFYKNLSTTSLFQITNSHAAGWTSIKKSLSDAAIGNQLAWRITQQNTQSFKLGGLDITFAPAGRRFSE